MVNKDDNSKNIKKTKKAKNPEAKYRPYAEALKWARTLGLKDRFAWNRFCKEGNCPADIPVRPNAIYKEWVNFDLWLDTQGQKTQTVAKVVDNISKVVMVCCPTNGAQNIIMITWASGADAALRATFNGLKQFNLNLLRVYRYEPGIEEILIALINMNVSRPDPNLTEVYETRFIIQNLTGLFFDLDTSLVPFKFAEAETSK